MSEISILNRLNINTQPNKPCGKQIIHVEVSMYKYKCKIHFSEQPFIRLDSYLGSNFSGHILLVKLSH